MAERAFVGNRITVCERDLARPGLQASAALAAVLNPVSFRLAADGRAAATLGSRDLRGEWQALGDGFEVALTASGSTLDGYLTIEGDRWRVDATYVDVRRITPITGWLGGEVEQAEVDGFPAASGEPVDGPAPVVAAAAWPGTVAEMSVPEFVLDVLPLDGTTEPHRAMLQFTPTDFNGSAFHLQWTCPEAAVEGWTNWEVHPLPRERFIAGEPLVVRSDGQPPLSFYGPGPDYEPAVAAVLELDFDPATFAVRGTLTVETEAGTRRQGFTGLASGHRVELLRRRIAERSLVGRWRPVLGPVGVVELVDPLPGQRADLPDANGFLRLGADVDTAVGLVKDVGVWVPVLLTRVLDGGPIFFTRAERMALRFLAVDLDAAGRYGEGELLAPAIEEHYEPLADAWPPLATSELISLMSHTDARARAAFTTADYPVLLASLERTIGLRRRLIDVPQGDAQAAEALASSAVEAAARLTGLIDSWRARLNSDAAKISALKDAIVLFARTISLLLEVGQAELALAVSEQSRARAFADLIAAADGAPRGTAADITPERLRRLLAEHRHPVVEFFLHEGWLTAWTCDGAGNLRSRTVLVDETELDSEVATLHRLLEAEDQNRVVWAELDGLLGRLGELIWSPVVTELLLTDPERLVLVVPHGPLLRVPFAALRPGGVPLLLRHTFAVLPALALLPDLTARAARRVDAEPSLVALVNPKQLPDEMRNLDRTEAGFGGITGCYPPGRSVVHTRQNASAARLREAGRDGSVLYLATHGVLGAESPDSYVALAITPGHDGRLRPAEILDLKLNAGLVILGTCHSGGGSVTSDGVLGVSRSFLAVGPHALVTTFCKVLEDTSLELLFEFHQAWLRDGRGLAQALRHAQLAFADSPRQSAWAPFTLFGFPGNEEAPE